MDGHGEFSPLERSRLLRSVLDGGSGAGSVGSNGSHPTSVSEYVGGRAVTPTTLTLAQYHNSRYGLPASMPGSNLALMSSLISGAHNSEARKALLIDFQQYWSAHTDNFPRYLMTGGLYPSYPPLLPGTAESLSLLGAGVACVATGANTGAGPSHSQHVAHYHRLLEMQKQACLASMSAAAANHHSALYGISASALPSFLEHAAFTSHGATPFSLVKQEPRELSCTEKTAKQGERRAVGFKVDLDLNRAGKESTLLSSSSSLGNTQNALLKEPKLSPSTSNGSFAKLDKRGSISSSSAGSSNGHRNVKKSSNQISTISNLVPRHNSESVRSKCISPSSRPVQQTSSCKSTSSSVVSKKVGSRSSHCVSKHMKTPTPVPVVSTRNCLAVSSPSAASLSESHIVSVPTQAAAPIPLATVQHDGVVLSALASPSSAAASLVSTKPTILKQQTDKLTSAGDHEHADTGKSLAASNTLSDVSTRQHISTPCYGNSSSRNPTIGIESKNINTSKSKEVICHDLVEDSRLISDDSSDIVVDSTENDDVQASTTASALPRSDQTRATEETIEKVAAAADNCAESDLDDATSPNCAKSSPDASNTSTQLSVSKGETCCVISCSGATPGTRTVYAKTQPVPSVTVSDCVQMTSSITTQVSASALPYYHTLYSKPQGARRVHATTYVPEVGIFKGPSIKTMTKSASLSSSSGASASSPESRSRLDPKSANNLDSFSPNGHFRGRDSASSPLLLYPSRDLTSFGANSSTASPVNAHTTTEISSSLDLASLDSASVRSHSVASFHSVPEVDDSDDSSDENDNGLVIDHETYESNHRTSDEICEDNSQRLGNNQQQMPSTVGCYDEILKTRHFDVNNDLATMKNDSIEHEETFSAAVSEKDISRNGIKSDIIIVCDLPMLSPTPDKSIPKLDSNAHQVPSELSDKTSCDSAIDYSLPKSSPVGSSTFKSNSSCDLTGRASNYSCLTSTAANAIVESLDSVRHHSQTNPTLADIKELEQTPRKKIAGLSKSFARNSFIYSSTSTTKLMTSPRKPLSRLEGAVSSVGKSVPILPSPHKRLKPTAGHLKLQTLTPASLEVLSKVTRRLRLHEEDCTKRCGSAPPTTSSSHLKPLKCNLLPDSETSNEKEMDLLEKMESSNDHSLGNNIPVGIAVAQIRPHHIQQQRESLTSEGLGHDIRHVHISVSNKGATQTTLTVASPGVAIPPSLVVAGHTVNPSPWLQQMSFSHHRAMNSSGATFDPRYPISAPHGFKFAHDSLTGQFFLVPSGDFVETGGVWPASSFVPPSGAGNSHYQATVTVPTINNSGPEGRERLSKGENTEKRTTPESRTGNIIAEQESISKDRTGIARGVEKHRAIAQPSLGGRSNSPPLGVITTNTVPATIVVNPVTSIAAASPPLFFKAEQPALESRGCSPIVFEGISSSLSLLSTLSSLTSKKTITSTIGVQTCDDLIKRSRKRKSSPTKLLSHDQAVQTASHDISTLNPLSVQCPDLDSVDSLTHTLEEKTINERASYNPFTDPQILQAADGLELLSALAEKRTKCSSLDDPKRIFPSPSDSFKSDSASIVAIEDTLSPADSDLRSGQCTPRRDVRRDLSPKWSLSKKEPHSVSVFADFKAPPDVEMPDDSEVRVKLAEVQRQYKEKQKELAKLQGKKSENVKTSKRGPGRPPKKKTHSKKSDDESSSSPSKTKEHHQPQKKKRPAEELVDRVFRKLPPVIKTCKTSRSIHYVKSKTGPFFRRKSASSSVKRNKDLFGFDESNWPSYSERKHQEKIKVTGSFSGKSKSRHRSSQSEDSKHSHDVGNIFSNLESFGGDYIERRVQTLKHHSYSHRKPLSCSGTRSIRSDHCSVSSHQESGLGLLAKFALTVTTNSLSSTSVSLALSSLATSTSSSISASGNQSSISSFSSNTFSTNISNSSIYCNSLYNSCSNMYNMGSASNGSHAPNITFGSLSSLMSSPSSGMMSFSSPSLTASSLNSSSTPTTASPSIFAQAAVLSTPTTPMLISPTSTTPVSTISSSPLFPSPGAHHTSTGESSSGTINSTTSSSANCSRTSNNTTSSSTASSSTTTNSSSGSVRDISPGKRRHEEADSDTDTSDTSPNKKRKPGRPRKINPEKSSGGTETIWAKKSSTIGLLQVSEPSCAQAKDGNSRKLDSIAMKPLFLDDEWSRRRSERIFLNEPSPLPSPALSPSPRGEPVWKLSHFMPKSKKVQDNIKSSKEGEKSKADSPQEQPPFLSVCPTLTSFLSPTVSSSTFIKTEGKEQVSPSSTVCTTTHTKSTEISSPKFEDAKMIVKLEHSITNLLTTSSFKQSRNSYHDKGQAMKKKVRKMVKSERSPTIISSSSSSSPPSLEKKEKRAEEHSKIKLQKAKSLHDLTQRVKKKFSKTGLRKQRDDQQKKDLRAGKNRKSSTESSENENLSIVSCSESPHTPEPRSCKLQPSDLKEDLKVLYLIDGLFHEGTVKALRPPDVYGVLTAGQRGNRPHILCMEEILKWAVLDVRPGSLRYLPEGTRVCTFWSQQFSCLYPGTVAKLPLYNGKKVIVPVDFDDGDNGRIELDHIRLLPADFPIVEYEPDPLEVLPKRKQRTMSESSDARKSVDKEQRPKKHSNENAESDDNGNKGKTDADSSDSGAINYFVRRELWRWDGKCTKKPGLKGKAKKIFYKAITRGKETIKVGDSAVFVSKDRVDCPYIGCIDSLWEGWNGQMMVKVHWYYHPEETESNKKLVDPRNALFESQHADENDVQTIAHKCEVIPHVNYRKLLTDATKKDPLKANVFYLAGFYDPAAKTITFYNGVASQ